MPAGNNGSMLGWYCFEGHYIRTLLVDAYKFDNQSWNDISFVKKVIRDNLPVLLIWSIMIIFSYFTNFSHWCLAWFFVAKKTNSEVFLYFSTKKMGKKTTLLYKSVVYIYVVIFSSFFKEDYWKTS